MNLPPYLLLLGLLSCQRAVGPRGDTGPATSSAAEALRPEAAATGPALPHAAASSEAPGPVAAQPTVPGAVTGSADGAELFGAAFANAPEHPLSALLKDPQKYSGQFITVSGSVQRVCQRKGCWMELTTTPKAPAALPAGPACRVKFKDYGFFVPKDAAGARATLQGELVVQRVTASRVKHLEQEGAVFASKNEDGSANELQFIASAVRLVR
jgi:hypothetical protein